MSDTNPIPELNPHTHNEELRAVLKWQVEENHRLLLRVTDMERFLMDMGYSGPPACDSKAEVSYETSVDMPAVSDSDLVRERSRPDGPARVQ